MTFVFRPAQPADLPAIHQVFLDSFNDLNTRTGQPRVYVPAADRESIRLHIMSTDPAGFWVAIREEDNTLVGWTAAIRRGRIWFLSGFWVHPSAQNQHVGATLLEHSLATAPDPAQGGVITVYASRDLRALTLYQRSGMFARSPLFTFVGSSDPQLAASAEQLLAAARLTVEVVEPGDAFTTAQAAAIKQLDEVVRGPDSDRTVDHQYFRFKGGFTTFIFSRDNQPVAYANLGPWGSIAPLAAIDEATQRPALRFLLGEAARRNIRAISLDVPGVNSVAIATLLEQHFTLLGFNFYLSSQDFGKMAQYVASGAVLF